MRSGAEAASVAAAVSCCPAESIIGDDDDDSGTIRGLHLAAGANTPEDTVVNCVLIGIANDDGFAEELLSLSIEGIVGHSRIKDFRNSVCLPGQPPGRGASGKFTPLFFSSLLFRYNRSAQADSDSNQESKTFVTLVNTDGVQKPVPNTCTAAGFEVITIGRFCGDKRGYSTRD